MILDNYINSAKLFLSMFNLKLEDKKVNELSKELEETSRINILDYYGNIVGNILSTKDYYYINIMLEDKVIASKSYRNMKEESTFNFKYDILNMSGNKLISGFFTAKKLESGKVIKSNEYRILKNNKSKKYCVFDSEKKEYYLKDRFKNVEVIFHDNILEFNTELYTIKLYFLDDYIYCEKKYNYFLSGDNMQFLEMHDEMNLSDTFFGYQVDLSNKSLSSEIYKILKEYAPKYKDFILEFKEESDKFFDGLYYNTINKTISLQELRGIFKDRSNQKIGEGSPVKKFGRRDKKRRNKENKKS